MTVDEFARTPGALLRQPHGSRFDLDRRLWGFGGVLGGLSLALLTAEMSERVPDATPRSVVARFHRPITGEFTVSASVVRAGRALSTVAGQCASGSGLNLDATAVFSSVPPGQFPVVAPEFPVVPEPADCESYPVSDDVPVVKFVDIRPVDENRPLAGGPRPELNAWVRCTEDDDAPDARRLIFLFDVLPPAFYSMVVRRYLIPTVELSIHFAGNIGTASSPWVLLRAKTRAIDSGGVLTEQVDAWGADGTYLGTAHQLRLAREP